MLRIPLTLSVLALCLGANVTQAEVYETTDAEGNTVFTDVPPNNDAQPVQLDSTNIADSVEVRPPEPTPEPAPAAAPEPAPEIIESRINTGDDDYDVIYEQRRREAIRDHIGDKPRPTPLPARPGGPRR